MVAHPEWVNDPGCVSPQAGAAGEDEEDPDGAALRLRLHPLHHQTLSIHPGQTRLPQLW